MLIHNISSMANRLDYEFNNLSSKLQHSGAMGSLREEVLKNCLREIIPTKFSIGTGIVVDAYDTQSKQQDFLIYDGFSSPRFLINEALVVLPVESIFATIEVKSTLNHTTLKQAVENARSVKALKKTLLYPPEPIPHVEPSNMILSCLFAYTSDVKLTTMQKNFDVLNSELPFEQRISIICILDKGCIVTAQKDNANICNVWPNVNSRTLSRPNIMQQNLYLFYLTLQTGLSLIPSYPPNLMRYANLNKSLQSKHVSFHFDTLLEGEKLVLDNVTYTGEDVQRIRRIKHYLKKEHLSDGDIYRSGFTRDELTAEIAWAKCWIMEINEQIHRNTTT